MSKHMITALGDEKITELIDLFKALGDNTRVSILTYLFDVESVCVSDLAEVVGMTTSAVSHQLKILKQNKLVKSKREGKQIYYSLADEHIKVIVAKAIEHVTEVNC